MQIIRDDVSYFPYSKKWSTKTQYMIPRENFNCTITGTSGVLVTCGAYVCMVFGVLLRENRRGILTHSEPLFLEENLSDIRKIIGQPSPYVDVVAIRSARNTQEELTKMREGLQSLFPNSDIKEVVYKESIEWVGLDIDEEKLVIRERKTR